MAAKPIQIEQIGAEHPDCVAYTYRQGHRQGRVYIFKGKYRDFLADPANRPPDFRPGGDLLVSDVSHEKNPDFLAFQAHRVGWGRYRAVIQCLMRYQEEFQTPVNRTPSSMLTEWRCHTLFALFAREAQDVDFDNAEEGKSLLYYFAKAIRHGFASIRRRLKK